MNSASQRKIIFAVVGIFLVTVSGSVWRMKGGSNSSETAKNWLDLVEQPER